MPEEGAALAPYFTVEMPPVMGVMSALVLAFVLGLGMAYIRSVTLKAAMDDFKRINDNYGHDLGDAALQNLVAQIHECIRADDFFARFGGDEFVIWMDGIHLGNVEAIKEKIQEVNHRTVLVANMTMRISVSAGVTFCRYGDAYKDALRRVDTALYEMKRTGKHGCAVYEEL